MTDSCAKREQNPHYGLYNGLKEPNPLIGAARPSFDDGRSVGVQPKPVSARPDQYAFANYF